jgi:hypothetical protein
MNHITLFAGNPAKHQSFYRLNGKARFFADVKHFNIRTLFFYPSK